MLQTIRDRLSGIMAIGILVLLAIPFAFVGVNSYFQSGTANLVALVDDTEITFTEFNQSFLNYRRRLQSLMGESFNPEEFDGVIARREHLDRMIDETVLRNAVDSMGLDVNNESLARRIQAISVFQVDGVFNMDVYQATLASQGLSIAQFEDDMRSDMLMTQLPGSIAGSSFATESELNEFVALQDQTRDYAAIVVPTDITTVSTDFPEEEIAAYYEANSDQFMTDEQVVIEYLELNTDNLGPFAEPSEEELRGKFEEQEGRFISPEQRQVSHVLLQVARDADDATKETQRQAAADITARARAGEDFAVLATEFSEDLGSASRGGDLGWVGPGDMVEAFENAVYELSLANPISDPVETGFGWHVIQLRDIEESSGQSFEEARMTLVEEYQSELADREFLDIADRIVDIVYEDPTTLEAASLDTGIPLFKEGPFSRAGSADGLSAEPDVVREAFSDLVLLQGSVSDPIDLSPNHMIMIRVDEHLPVKQKPLEEVRAEIVAALTEQAAQEAAEARANELLASFQASGQSLAEFAAENGLEVVEVAEAPRRHAEPDVVVVSGVFRLPAPAEGAAESAVVPAANGFAVVSLDAVTMGAIEEGALLGQQTYRRQIANIGSGIENRALVAQLRSQAKVQVFEENLGVSR